MIKLMYIEQVRAVENTYGVVQKLTSICVLNAPIDVRYVQHGSLNNGITIANPMYKGSRSIVLECVDPVELGKKLAELSVERTDYILSMHIGVDKIPRIKTNPHPRQLGQ